MMNANEWSRTFAPKIAQHRKQNIASLIEQRLFLNELASLKCNLCNSNFVLHHHKSFIPCGPFFWELSYFVSCFECMSHVRDAVCDRPECQDDENVNIFNQAHIVHIHSYSICLYVFRFFFCHPFRCSFVTVHQVRHCPIVADSRHCFEHIHQPPFTIRRV